jgi:F-type H+-transporting ATPase subunit c
MARWLQFLLVFGLVTLMAGTVSAQESGVTAVLGQALQGGIEAIGLGLVVIGIGLGIGRIGGSACESAARQPEMFGKIQTLMLISAALIEGAGFFALILCLAV